MMLPRKDISLRAWQVCVRATITGALTAVVIATSIAAYCILLRYTGNVHVVESGKLYRSAQLEGPQLKQVINEYGIRSIRRR